MARYNEEFLLFLFRHKHNKTMDQYVLYQRGERNDK